MTYESLGLWMYGFFIPAMIFFVAYIVLNRIGHFVSNRADRLYYDDDPRCEKLARISQYLYIAENICVWISVVLLFVALVFSSIRWYVAANM